jgi:hypothetical protein
MELKSLTQQSECSGAESGCLRILSECLGDSSMRLGVPFITLRQLGAIGRQSWKANLAFCRVVHQTVRCTTGQSLYLSGARLPSKKGAVDRCSFGPDGAPDTVRCTPDTIRCTPDSPVPPADCWCGPRVARRLHDRPLRWRPLAHRTVRCTTEQSGAPPNSPVHHQTVR